MCIEQQRIISLFRCGRGLGACCTYGAGSGVRRFAMPRLTLRKQGDVHPFKQGMCIVCICPFRKENLLSGNLVWCWIWNFDPRKRHANNCSSGEYRISSTYPTKRLGFSPGGKADLKINLKSASRPLEKPLPGVFLKDLFKNPASFP